MKKYFISVLVVIMAIAFNAFTVKQNLSKRFTGEIYWVFNGSPGQEGDPAQYSEAPGDTPTCAGSSSNLCNIFAQRDAVNTNQPDLSTEVVADRTFKP